MVHHGSSGRALRMMKLLMHADAVLICQLSLRVFIPTVATPKNSHCELQLAEFQIMSAQNKCAPQATRRLVVDYDMNRTANVELLDVSKLHGFIAYTLSSKGCILGCCNDT